ncbi:uncharacterized protein EDB91DRAFT_152188 [Suillus paluster]|uniref:uncharacterized protein n=1 Tax=Suillus paluster TaxID=48578 RepID=UPI001B861D7A|nr:uncharacterized protein EDB91DRAFT_152188 [Suillus paluster]KAG1745522.1 hypothetical protein EDB91DRAFT_152188 [Suillus paluster]
MSAKVYVGNLSWNTTDESLRHAFSEFGNVLDVRDLFDRRSPIVAIVMKDRETGRSRGFGFVTFGAGEEADGAINGMNEQELDGRRLRVNLANARPSGGRRRRRLPGWRRIRRRRLLSGYGFKDGRSRNSV